MQYVFVSMHTLKHPNVFFKSSFSQSFSTRYIMIIKVNLMLIQLKTFKKINKINTNHRRHIG